MRVRIKMNKLKLIWGKDYYPYIVKINIVPAKLLEILKVVQKSFIWQIVSSGGKNA